MNAYRIRRMDCGGLNAAESLPGDEEILRARNALEALQAAAKSRGLGGGTYKTRTGCDKRTFAEAEFTEEVTCGSKGARTTTTLYYTAMRWLA